jgi:NAD-specific glutamate dehydrogenase
MSVFAEWKASRERRERASSYLATLLPDPRLEDIQWFGKASASADTDVVRRELRLARRAVGLIVAERDALDDRTASDVAHLLADVIRRETRTDPILGRAWAERWRAYSAALTARGVAEAPAARLARVLLATLGVDSPDRETLAHVTQWVLTQRAEANESLRAAFGVASLPEDVKPSALRPEQRTHG